MILRSTHDSLVVLQRDDVHDLRLELHRDNFARPPRLLVALWQSEVQNLLHASVV